MNNHPDVQTLLEDYTPAVQAIALALRELVLGVAPDAIEQMDSAARMLAYGFARTYKDTICVIMPLKAGVNLGFPHGTIMPDPAESSPECWCKFSFRYGSGQAVNWSVWFSSLLSSCTAFLASSLSAS